jgi:hypothetical protein
VTAHRYSMIGVAFALVIAAHVALVMFVQAGRDPALTRRTWCPSPEDRIMPATSLTDRELLARLREIRAKVARLEEEGPILDDEDARDQIHEVGAMLFELICDVDLASTPLMEARP